MLVGIHQNQINKNWVQTFSAAFQQKIVQVFIWNNHLYLYENKMQDIYNNIMQGYEQVNKLECKHFIIHADYLLQLDSKKEKVIQESTKDFYVMMTIAGNLQQRTKTKIYVNVHLCSVNDKNLENVLKILQQTPDNITLLLENVAKIKFDDFIQSYNQIKPYIDNTGITLDTAHLYGSGTQIEQFMNDYDNKLYDEIKLIHLNGNEKKFNSMQDKHLSVLSKQDNIFGGARNVSEFITFVKRQLKNCVGFILERNEQTYSQEERFYLDDII